MRRWRYWYIRVGIWEVRLTSRILLRLFGVIGSLMRGADRMADWGDVVNARVFLAGSRMLQRWTGAIISRLERRIKKLLDQLEA